MSLRKSPSLSSIVGKKRAVISSSLKVDELRVVENEEEEEHRSSGGMMVVKEDHTSPMFTVVSHPPIPPSLNMKQEPESKKRKINGVRNDLNIIVSRPESFDSQKESKSSESPWEKDILQADMIRHEILSTRTFEETTNEKKVNAGDSNDCEIDAVAHNLSNTLLNLHKSNPWIDTASNSKSTLNATSSSSKTLQERSMSPKMRWKIMNNTTPRSSSILKLFLFDDASVAANTFVKSPSCTPLNTNDENIATAAVASVMYGNGNSSSSNFKQEFNNNATTLLSSGSSSNNNTNYESKVMESPTNVNVLVEAATRISKPIDSIRQHLKMINANGGKSLTPTKSKNLLKQLETAANMLERTTKRKVAVRRVRWTSDEDEKLKKLVKKYNGRQWKLVAKGIGQRSAAQCRQRWAGLCCPNKTKRACKYIFSLYNQPKLIHCFF